MLQFISDFNVSRYENRHQRNAKLVFKNDTNHTKGCTSQSIGVLTSRRPFVNDPKTHQSVNLIGKGDGNAQRISRHAITWTLRLVVIFYSLGDRWLHSLGQLIVLTHQSLHLREFAYDF